MSLLQLNPAACDGRAQPTSPNAISEEKIDGHRGLLHLGKDFDRGYMTGRRVSVKTGLLTEKGENVPHLSRDLNEWFKIADVGYTVLDGEMLIEDQPFESVQSVLGSLPAQALSRQRSLGYITYIVFDLLFFDGEDLRGHAWSYRRNSLACVFACLQRYSDNLLMVDTRTRDHEMFYEEVIARGGEGLVIKDSTLPYGKGWSKWKKAVTHDVVITGAAKGSGKYQEMVGAVKFGAYESGQLVSVGQCSGMDDGRVWWSDADGNEVRPNSSGSRIRPSDGEQPVGSRAWFTANQEELVGQVMEVKSNGVTRHGALRHPRFIRMRPDKPAQECKAPDKG